MFFPVVEGEEFYGVAGECCVPFIFFCVLCVVVAWVCLFLEVYDDCSVFYADVVVSSPDAVVVHEGDVHVEVEFLWFAEFVDESFFVEG